MNRRAFIAGLGSAAAWPLVARAQQTPRYRVVGFLHQGAREANEGRFLGAEFRRGLRAKRVTSKAKMWRSRFRWAEGPL